MKQIVDQWTVHTYGGLEDKIKQTALSFQHMPAPQTTITGSLATTVATTTTVAAGSSCKVIKGTHVSLLKNSKSGPTRPFQGSDSLSKAVLSSYVGNPPPLM